MARFDSADIRGYYDRQTAGFLRLGQGGREGAIRRAVWGPGVRFRSEAFHYVDDRLAERLRGLAAGTPHVVDLGCGVGGSLCYLARRLPGLRATGITISAVQARLAAIRIAAAGLGDRVRCLEGDFTALPPGLEVADLAFAIEAFVHARSPGQFFDAAASLVRPGGWLVICDDVRGRLEDARGRRAVERFERGWHLNSLVTPDTLRAAAAAAGFVHESTVDLTPWVERRRPRDRLLAAVVALAGWLPLAATPFAHLTGGVALQRCLARGWVRYELAVFQRAARR